MAIDDNRIEQLFLQFRRALNAGEEFNLDHKQALVERFRVELMVTDCSPRRRAIYRAIIDMFEDIIEEEADRLSAAKPKGSRALVAYMKRLFDSLV